MSEEVEKAKGVVLTVTPDGTEDTLTLQEAIARAREIEGEVRLSLAPGEYFLEEPLELT